LILLYSGFGTAIASSVVHHGHAGGAVHDMLVSGAARRSVTTAVAGWSVRRKGKDGGGFMGWLRGHIRKSWAGQVGCAG
jgi:hypothetical protein